jgi:hypothetical protein
MVLKKLGGDRMVKEALGVTINGLFISFGGR